MSLLLRPIEVVAAMLAEWVRHLQEKMIEFLHEELEVLREQMGDKRIEGALSKVGYDIASSKVMSHIRPRVSHRFISPAVHRLR